MGQNQNNMIQKSTFATASTFYNIHIHTWEKVVLFNGVVVEVVAVIFIIRFCFSLFSIFISVPFCLVCVTYMLIISHRITVYIFITELSISISACSGACFVCVCARFEKSCMCSFFSLSLCTGNFLLFLLHINQTKTWKLSRTCDRCSAILYARLHMGLRLHPIFYFCYFLFFIFSFFTTCTLFIYIKRACAWFSLNDWVHFIVCVCLPWWNCYQWVDIFLSFSLVIR